ncbi:MAG: rod shape-determining protein MreD [Edaphocola sp.]
MSIYLRNIIRFVLLVLIQVLLLKQIPLSWWTAPGGIPPYVPYIYPLFLLALPFGASVPFLMIAGFVMGLTIDMYMDTGGIHAAACVLMAFVRTNILAALLPRRLAEYQNTSPGIRSMGWAPFMTYAAILLAIHHIAFFTLEIWSMVSFGYLLVKILVSLVTSSLFVFLYALFFSNSIGTVYYDNNN